MDAPESSSTPSASDPAQNSVRPSKHRRLQSEPASSAPPSGEASPANAVPQEIAKRFVQVRNKYYFPDGARAFTDRGNRLTTPSENTEVVRSLIGIARARGWHDITVRGTERFRHEAWVQASNAGIQLRGYRPSEFEQERLVRSLAREKAGDSTAAPSPGGDTDSIARGAAGDESAASSSTRVPRADRGALLIGKLLDHRRATYRHDPKAAMSYFVKLETSEGPRVVWGVDLERAVRESLTKPQIGDEVGLRSLAQEKVKIPTRDAAGRVTGEGNVERVRNRWVVEKRAFFEARAAAARSLQDPSVNAKQAVREHPELKGPYLAVHAAELVAKRMRNSEDQARFVAIVRAALADSVSRGEPQPAVRLRNREKARTLDPREREPESPRG
jgi:hypothetical protein